MAKGIDERHNSNRKVSKEALGNRYVEIGVGFDDVSDPQGDDYDPQDSSKDELKYMDKTGIDPYTGLHEDDERYDRNKDEPGALLPSQQTGNRYEY